MGFKGPNADLIMKIRHSVFTLEQKVDPDLDLDGRDSEAVHVLAKINGRPAGTGRMLADGHIGRVAVVKSHREKGVGLRVVQHLIAEARTQGFSRVFLGAQIHAVSFYREIGFSVYGSPYEEAGISHVHMEMMISVNKEGGLDGEPCDHSLPECSS